MTSYTSIDALIAKQREVAAFHEGKDCGEETATRQVLFDMLYREAPLTDEDIKALFIRIFESRGEL